MRVGEPFYHVDSAIIESLKPDLLLAQAYCEVCAVTPGDVRRSTCGLDESQIVPLQAGSLDGIFADIERIASVLGVSDKGAQLVANLRQRLNDLHDALKSRRRPTVVMLEWTDPVFAMGNWGPELVEYACGELLIGNRKSYSQTIDWSSVREADPEFLIIAPCGYDLERTKRELPVLSNYPGWSELQAVRSGNVFFADGNKYFNRSGITAIDSAEIIADILHGTSFHKSHDGKPAWCRVRR